MSAITLHEGDCLEVLADLPEAHFDAIVTDPPYHLTSIVKRFGGDGAAEAKPGSDGLFQRSSKGFMGKTWDGGDIAFRAETWQAALRVLKPGGHLVAFSAARTYHHMALAIELAGFEMRDAILSLYSADGAWRDFLDTLEPEQVSALCRAMAGADAPLLAWLYGCGFPKSHDVSKGIDKLLGATREKLGEGQNFGRSKLQEGKAAYGDFAGSWDITKPSTPDAAAWEGWGTALKPAWEPIVLARKPIAESSVARQHLATGTGGLNIDAARIPSGDDKATKSGNRAAANGWGAAPGKDLAPDRWPANVCHDGSQEVMLRFPVDAGASSARFFYSGKADKTDRAGSKHPTVKPQALMRWLVRLTTPRGGRVLDMFGGSGSTGWAAATESRECDLIERDPGYAAHIRQRIPDFDPNQSAAPRPTERGDRQADLFERP